MPEIQPGVRAPDFTLRDVDGRGHSLPLALARGPGASGVALDSSGNGYNGNLINIATSTFYSIGKIGQGFNFDGTDDVASNGKLDDVRLYNRPLSAGEIKILYLMGR